MEPSPGALVAGRYRVVRELERGPLSVVFEAEDVDLGRAVALKLLAPGADAERFREEARAGAALDDPTVRRVFDFGETPAGPYVVTELVPGGTVDVPPAAAGALAGATTVAARPVDAAASPRRLWRPNRRAAVAAGALGALALAAYGLAAVVDRGHADGDGSPTAPRTGAAPTTDETDAVTPTAAEPGPASSDETGDATTTGQPATTQRPKPKPPPPAPAQTAEPPPAPATPPPPTSEEPQPEPAPPEPPPATTETTPPAPLPPPEPAPVEPPPPPAPPSAPGPGAG